MSKWGIFGMYTIKMIFKIFKSNKRIKTIWFIYLWKKLNWFNTVIFKSLNSKSLYCQLKWWNLKNINIIVFIIESFNSSTFQSLSCLALFPFYPSSMAFDHLLWFHSFLSYINFYYLRNFISYYLMGSYYWRFD